MKLILNQETVVATVEDVSKDDISCIYDQIWADGEGLGINTELPYIDSIIAGE